MERRVERRVRRVRKSSKLQCGEEAREMRVARDEGGQEDLPASVVPVSEWERELEGRIYHGKTRFRECGQSSRALYLRLLENLRG